MTHDTETPPETGEAPTPTAVERITTDRQSRERFIRMVGGGAATLAFGSLLAACGNSSKTDHTAKKTTSTKAAGGGAAAGTTDTAMAADVKGDLAILNYALTLEYLEAAFYAKVIGSGLFSGPSLDLIKAIGDHEQQHVAALTATVKKLGGTPATEPKSDFPTKSPGQVLGLAATVENLGAAAYLGQAGNIKNMDVLAAALSIHSVEARHASALNVLTGKSPTPDGSFAKPADMATVLAAVKPFLVA